MDGWSPTRMDGGGGGGGYPYSHQENDGKGCMDGGRVSLLTPLKMMENGKGRKLTFHKNLLIIYHPIDFCVIHCRNATPASEPASYYYE